MSTSVEVISLPQAQQRRRAFEDCAREAQTPWRFLDATSGLPPDLRYDAVRAKRRFGRALSDTEVSCFGSHYRAWRNLLDSSDSQRIVLEDDVLVDWNSLDRLSSVNLGQLGLHLVRLYATHPFRHRLVTHRFLGPHLHLIEARGLYLGAQGYVITRLGAERLIAQANPVDSPLDWLMTRYWDSGLPNYCLFPFPLIERFVPSNIGDRSSAPTPAPLDRLLRFGWRARDRLSRAAADWGRFRQPPLEKGRDAGMPFVDRHQEFSTPPTHEGS